VDVLRGSGPDDVTELTMVFGEVMLELAGVPGGRDRLEAAIASGEALQKLVTTVSNLSPEMLAKVRTAYVTGQQQ